ncbi:flagellar protein MotY [Photobacterium angustum]|uniref:flagellar protein MotY n=1 Tax=Photobacterium angustum TaxID=661 RepID=UPI0006970096|nr:OmpA family protein [Photobacterium angustum]PSV95873.1 OmpA family protein [Photobacterium angustum]PSW83097.1 OmpA family protein [Photobacterium angustum]
MTFLIFKKWPRSLYILILLFSLPSWAGKQYIASPNQSQWNVIVDTPLECRLSHHIPGYGDGEFVARSSKKQSVAFELKMYRPMGETRNVRLTSMPARWMPGDSANTMTRLKFFKQFDGYIQGKTVWNMLAELEDGRNPTFMYQDWQRQNRLLEVGLSAVAFQKGYQSFSQCLSKLLPYGFEDIAFSVLHYSENSDTLNKISQQRLAQIADFVRYSDDIDLVLVAAFNDSIAGTTESQEMSERRAEKLRQYFQSLGLPAERVQVEAYGKRRPIADNSTPMGRNLNRRVVISLGQSPIY